MVISSRLHADYFRLVDFLRKAVVTLSRQEKLTWWLLKEGVSRDDVVVENASVSGHIVSPLTTRYPTLFVRATPPHDPGWQNYLERHVRGGLSGLHSASAGAILVVEAAARVFAVTLGQGRHFLNKSVVEPDFGLRVVLNTVEPDQLKSVDAKTFEERTVHTRREVSQSSSIAAFTLDLSRDLLRGVTGKPRDSSLGPWLTGSDSLGMLTHTDVPELAGLAGRLLTEYRSEAYREHFDFVDFLRPEKSIARIQDLEESLIEVLRLGPLTDLHLAAPEPLNWSDMAGFRYSTSRGQPDDADPRVSRYLSTKSRKDITMDDLRRDRLLAISASTTYEQESWPIFKCIVYEVMFEKQLYVLSGGEWFKVSLDFKDRVYSEIGLYTRELAILPGADAGTTEDAYNVKAAGDLGGLCLDKRFIYDGGPDRMEICDVLTREGGFIHVKNRGASSTLSHLFAQGLNSAERFLLDADFRSRARDLLAADDPAFIEFFSDRQPDPGAHEVTFAVITRSTRDTPLTLPFFSVVSLRSVATRLRAMGFPVSIAAVREADG